MSDWVRQALARIASGGEAVLVTVLAIEGSTPREAGTKMLIWSGGQAGTIGGGALEYQATLQAHRMLDLGPQARFAIQDYPLGPLLAQCCGGRVRLLIERLDARDADWLGQLDRLRAAEQAYEIRTRINDGRLFKSVASVADPTPADGPVTIDGQPAQARAARPDEGCEIVERSPPAAAALMMFGAGHVGLALARVLAPLPFRLSWYDSRPEAQDVGGVMVRPGIALVELAAATCPFVLILTHDHALDYALTAAALGAGGDGYVGVIGSRTKRARFLGRLRAAGFSDADLARMVCPIGLPGLKSKAPEVIAVSVAADLLLRLEARRAAPAREMALAGL